MRGIGRDELEAQRPHAPLAALGQRIELRAGDPQRRVRLLHRLGHDHAQRHVEVLALVFAGAVLEHRDDGAHRLLEDFALVLHVDAERLEFGDRGTFAHAEFGPAARQQVEHRHALGDVGGMVCGELQDAVAQPDLLGALAGRRQERGGRGRVGIFLEEVVLDLPGIVVAQPVGELELAQRVLVEPVLVAFLPGSRQLQLIEDAELHGPFLPVCRCRQECAETDGLQIAGGYAVSLVKAVWRPSPVGRNDVVAIGGDKRANPRSRTGLQECCCPARR